VNRRWQNRQTQEWEEQVSFFDIVCWREMAENVSESIQKGSRVVVTGRLEQRSWETSDGDKRSKIEVVADEVGRRSAGRQHRSPGMSAVDPPREHGRQPTGRCPAQGGGPRLRIRRGALLVMARSNYRGGTRRAPKI